jgi:hypothetical protein
MEPIKQNNTNKPNNNTDNKYEQNGKFNTTIFNSDFDTKIKNDIMLAQNIEAQKLNEINQYYIKYNENKNKDEKQKNYVSEFFASLTDKNRDLFIDIFKFNYDFNGFLHILTKENRLFYLGMLILIIGIVGYVINNILFDDYEQKYTPNSYDSYTFKLLDDKIKSIESNVSDIKKYDMVNTEQSFSFEKNTDSGIKDIKISKEMAKDLSKEMAKDISKEMAKDISKEMAKDLSKEMAKDLSKSVSESSGGFSKKFIFSEKMNS